ncbi:Protein translocase subunit SecF [hydrothermal vent metagenome]|uniref:Protein translocase subunit SecF n=1 Tax=hydrothermal vent metagenome TaxID=652676 RepID=A0A3B0RA82_9ZZZZ
MALAFVRIIPEGTHYRFVRLRNMAFAFSIAAVFGSMVAFFTLGINLGIDFKGGGNIEIETEAPANLTKIGSIVRGLGLGEVEVREFGSPTEVLIRFERQTSTDPEVNEEKLQQTAARKVHTALYQSYSDIKIEFDGDRLASVTSPNALDLEKGQAAMSSLGVPGLELAAGEDANSLVLKLPEVVIDRKTGPELQQQLFGQAQYKLLETYSTLTSQRTEIVGPKVSGELVRSGITAVLGALFCMLIYIWLRFEWQFSVGAVVALIHDVLLTIGMFSLTRIEFNLASIAAILTIVGYSMNDTVVVYDRIREKLRKFKKMALPDLIDLAINKTLSRTSITSLTTLLALVSLYFLGGEALRGFAITMIWGVVVGTYSSIFIAAPVLLFLGVDRTEMEES